MALTEMQARELRSLMSSWQRTSNEVGELLRGGAVKATGLDLQIVRKAVDARSAAEDLVISFWTRIANS